MQRTETRQRTNTTEAVRYIQNRILGDLLAINEKFELRSEQHMRDLAHDVGEGLFYDCLDRFSVFLYRPYCDEPHRAYRYRRVAPGSFDHSLHSGRIVRDNSLVGGRFESEISPKDRFQWEELKRQRKLILNWMPCRGRSTAGMSERTNGGYESGAVGVSRTYLTR